MKSLSQTIEERWSITDEFNRCTRKTCRRYFKNWKKRGADEILGINTDAMSVKQIRKLLVNKGILPRKMNMGGVVSGQRW